MQFTFAKTGVAQTVTIKANNFTEALEKFKKNVNDQSVRTIPVSSDDVPELVGQIIDIFEDFLDERGIILDNPERDEDEDLDPEEAANIFGTDYGELQDAIEETLANWGLASSRENTYEPNEDFLN